jgi:hypothetical protein
MIAASTNPGPGTLRSDANAEALPDITDRQTAFTHRSSVMGLLIGNNDHDLELQQRLVIWLQRHSGFARMRSSSAKVGAFIDPVEGRVQEDVGRTLPVADVEHVEPVVPAPVRREPVVGLPAQGLPRPQGCRPAEA